MTLYRQEDKRAGASDLGVRQLAVAGLLAAGSIMGAASAGADTIGFYAGAGTWLQDYSGDARSGIDTIDLEDDLGYDDNDNLFVYAALEHPIPFLPNIRVARSDLKQDAANELTRTVVFNGTIYSFNSDVTSDLDIEQTDVALYYQVLDNAVSLDLGLAARFVDGSVAVSDAVNSSAAEFKGVLPMLYVSARVDLPFSGLWAGARAQGLAYDGDSLIDADAQVGWESPIGLGFEVGYRLLKLDVEEFDELDEATIEVSGPYAALTYHF